MSKLSNLTDRVYFLECQVKELKNSLTDVNKILNERRSKMKDLIIYTIRNFHKTFNDNLEKFVDAAEKEATEYAMAIMRKDDSEVLLDLFLKWHKKYSKKV